MSDKHTCIRERQLLWRLTFEGPLAQPTRPTNPIYVYVLDNSDCECIWIIYVGKVSWATGRYDDNAYVYRTVEVLLLKTYFEAHKYEAIVILNS